MPSHFGEKIRCHRSRNGISRLFGKPFFGTGNVSESKGIFGGSEALSATSAKINTIGDSIKISDINVGLSKPGEVATYFFMIKNEGQYDAYVDFSSWFESNKGSTIYVSHIWENCVYFTKRGWKISASGL